MTRSANTRRIQQTLFLLRKDYGGPVVVYRLLSASADAETGVRQTNVDTFEVAKAIVLPVKWSLEEIRGISLISSNKSLVQGGWYQAGKQAFIIDSRDLGFEPSVDDWLIHDGRRFNFESVEMAEDHASWVIVAKALPGRAEGQVFVVKAESFISLTSEATNAGES